MILRAGFLFHCGLGVMLVFSVTYLRANELVGRCRELRFPLYVACKDMLLETVLTMHFTFIGKVRFYILEDRYTLSQRSNCTQNSFT